MASMRYRLTDTRTIAVRATALRVMLFVALCIVQPLAAQIQVVGDLTVARSCRPGDSLEAQVIVQNTGTETVDVKVYQHDYVFYADGTVSYLEPGEIERSNASWISYSPSIVRIPEAKEIHIALRIRVPEHVDQDGTYWSLLLIEPIPPERERQEADDDEFRLNVKQVVRYGVQIVTTVGNDSRPALSFRNPTLYSGTEGKVLEADVENSGDAWIHPVYFCEIYDPMGEMVGRIDLPRQRIYPDTSIRLSFTLPDLAAGTHKALVVADAGGDRLFGAQYTLNIK